MSDGGCRGVTLADVGGTMVRTKLRLTLQRCRNDRAAWGAAVPFFGSEDGVLVGI